jgi:hypothetical protein
MIKPTTLTPVYKTGYYHFINKEDRNCYTSYLLNNKKYGKCNINQLISSSEYKIVSGRCPTTHRYMIEKQNGWESKECGKIQHGYMVFSMMKPTSTTLQPIYKSGYYHFINKEDRNCYTSYLLSSKIYGICNINELISSSEYKIISGRCPINYRYMITQHHEWESKKCNKIQHSYMIFSMAKPTTLQPVYKTGYYHYVNKQDRQCYTSYLLSNKKYGECTINQLINSSTENKIIYGRCPSIFKYMISKHDNWEVEKCGQINHSYIVFSMLKPTTTTVEDTTTTFEPTTTTANPTNLPTKRPSDKPSNNPSKKPTEKPTKRPTDKPSNNPSQIPTNDPTKRPTDKPSNNPSQKPTNKPTKRPTVKHLRYSLYLNLTSNNSSFLYLIPIFNFYFLK